MAEFLARLRQRKLVQWAIAWVAFAFALLQGVDIVAQRFHWPASVERYLILALAIGFFVVLVLAWYHGERGAQRVGSMEIMILALLLAIGGGLTWRFGTVAKAPRPIPTAAVATPASSSPAARAPAMLAATTAKIPEKSVAVLPFVNESGSKDEQFFSDGLSEDLIIALSQFEGLKVISRHSAFQFRGSKDSSARIGKLLGVAHLLEGSVQRAGDEVRISAMLVNAADGRVIWSERYDKPYKDLFALQDAITKAVAGALKAKLLTTPGAVVQTDHPPSGNLDAYAAYLRGRSKYLQGSEPSTRQAIADFEQAIRLDPHYARAYATEGYAWTRLGITFLGGKAQQRAYDKARRAIDKALHLNPDLAAGYTARSFLESYGEFDWKAVQRDIRHALQLAPGDSSAKFGLANLSATLGDVNRAISLTKAVLKTDPRNGDAYFSLSTFFSAVEQLRNAGRAIRAAIALQPQRAANNEQLAIIEILRGDTKAALAAAQQATDPAWREVALALALQIGPDRDAADTALKKLIADHAGDSAYQIAEVYALRRDPDAMFRWLERAWANHDAGIGGLLYDPFILRYRDDPRFAALCKKIGLPSTTDAVAMR